MNEYQVIYTDSNGKQQTEVYKAASLGEFKQSVLLAHIAGYEFQIYQLVPVHTDWVEQWSEENQNA